MELVCAIAALRRAMMEIRRKRQIAIALIAGFRLPVPRQGSGRP
jgi:hypothetical protein